MYTLCSTFLWLSFTLTLVSPNARDWNISCTLTMTTSSIREPKPKTHVPQNVHSNRTPRAVVPIDNRLRDSFFLFLASATHQKVSQHCELWIFKQLGQYVRGLLCHFQVSDRYRSVFHVLVKVVYFRVIHFVRGLIRGVSIRSIHFWLSSCAVQWITGVDNSKEIDCLSLRRRLIRGNTSRRDRKRGDVFRLRCWKVIFVCSFA